MPPACVSCTHAYVKRDHVKPPLRDQAACQMGTEQHSDKLMRKALELVTEQYHADGGNDKD